MYKNYVINNYNIIIFTHIKKTTESNLMILNVLNFLVFNYFVGH